MGGLYLGIDQSLRKPGFALVDEDGRVVHGASPKVGDAVRGAARLHASATYLRGLNPIQVLGACIEGPSLGSTHREFDLGEISGALKLAVYDSWSVEALVVPPSSLKLYATGYGHADKAAVVDAVRKSWGYEPADDDVADAVVLAQLARALHSHARPETRARAEVLQSLRAAPKSLKKTRAPRGNNI